MALAATAATLLAGCGAAAQPLAVTFVKERRVNAQRTQRAIERARTDLAALGTTPTRQGLRKLEVAARVARERVNEERVGLASYEAAEEEVPIAEDEAGSASNELNNAMGELVRYARQRTRAALTRYREYFERGRIKWNESLTELWRLARTPSPPLLRESV